MLRRIVPVILLVMLSGALYAAAEEQKLPVTLVTGVKGLGDKGPNDMAWEGVKRAANEFSCPINVIQSKAAADYAANLTAAAEKAKVVVTVGAELADATREVAGRFSGVYFVQIGGEVEGPPNVATYDFNGEETGFLAGVVAGLYTKTGVVGLASGSKSAAAQAFEVGFSAGVSAVVATTGKKKNVMRAPAGTFDDVERGRALAGEFVTRGCDVVVKSDDKTGDGIWEGVKDKPAVKVIWQDVDGDGTAEGKVLASTIKHIDVAVFEGVKMAIDRTWESGRKVLGYREGGVGLSEMKYSKQLFTAEELAMLERAKGLLGRAEITVPSKDAELKDYKAPVLTSAKD
jgi:basic membrane protein A